MLYRIGEEAEGAFCLDLVSGVLDLALAFDSLFFSVSLFSRCSRAGALFERLRLAVSGFNGDDIAGT